MNVAINRIQTNEPVTYGIVSIEGRAFCLSLELPWKDNAPNVSCIPIGKYKCCMITRPSGENAYLVQNVPNRNAILFHSGNSTKDIKGCILLGREFGKFDNNPDILRSKETIKEFMEILNNADFDLEIC